MIGLLLSAALLSGGSPIDDASSRATWYGAHCVNGTEYGRSDACSPYVSTEDGGRGGELTRFAAVGWYRFGMPTVQVLVTSLDTGRSIIATVRDYCEACARGNAAIDLSPVLFSLLWRDGDPDKYILGIGVARVELRYLGAR